MGHGQGMLLTEPPSVAPDDHTRLMPGVVLSMEPGVIGHDGVSVLWEDVLVVTETGSSRITLETDDLREVPW
jgi:Xaa-Pro aminopeptidase